MKSQSHFPCQIIIPLPLLPALCHAIPTKKNAADDQNLNENQARPERAARFREDLGSAVSGRQY